MTGNMGLVELCRAKPWIETHIGYMDLGQQMLMNSGVVIFHGPALSVLAWIELGEFYRDGGA